MVVNVFVIVGFNFIGYDNFLVINIELWFILFEVEEMSFGNLKEIVGLLVFCIYEIVLK